MANTKNSQAAKIRAQIIAWLQDPEEVETVSEQKFPGIQGIRAVKLRQMLGEQGYVASVVMGAVSAAPSIDHRIKKAALKPREVYYYFDATAAKPKRAAAAPARPNTAQATVNSRPVTATPRVTQPLRTTALPATGLVGTPAFATLQAATQDLTVRMDQLLDAAQQAAPLDDLEITFLTNMAAQVAKQTEILQNFQTQARIERLRRK